MNFAEFLTNGGPVLTVHLLALNVVAVIASFLARRSWLRTATLGTFSLSCLVQLATMVCTLLTFGAAGLEPPTLQRMRRASRCREISASRRCG